MEGYLDFIRDIVGAGAIVPLLFIMAIGGPFFVYKCVHNDKPCWQTTLKWPVAAVTFFSCLLVCISTAGYLGSIFGSADLGMGLGLVVFYYLYSFFTSLLPSTCEIPNK